MVFTCDGFDFDLKASVTEYSVKIFNKCNISYSNIFEGQLFNKELKHEFEKLQKGDWVIFNDVKINRPDRSSEVLSKPIFLEIE